MASARDWPRFMSPSTQTERSPHPTQYCWYLSQRQASPTCRLSWSPERAWEVSVKGQVRGVGATFCSINHNVLGRVGVSWFYQSGPTSALSAWPRTSSPTAHAGLYFSPLFFLSSDSLLHHRTCQRARYERVQVCQKCMAKIRSKSQSTIHTLVNSAVIGSHFVFAGNKLIHLCFVLFFVLSNLSFSLEQCWLLNWSLTASFLQGVFQALYRSQSRRH